MSGIIGILRRDGAPADAEEIARFTSFLSFRGPDAQRTWVSGSVGFGHAALRPDLLPASVRPRTPESSKEQPLSLDGTTWITADARLDARAELMAALAGPGREVPGAASDAELILHAYAAWGEDCVQHLLGDFAFAIWDAGQRRLFCARDHFGVRPFFYVQGEHRFIFSNTLNCIRLHPELSTRLNDLFLADVLLFGYSQDFAATVFADIQRLPPAHALTVAAGEVHLRHYWSLPVEEPLRYRREADYVEQFRELLTRAVADRLPTSSEAGDSSSRAALLMSGGLDSSSVAAAAKQAAQRSKTPVELRAFTLVSAALLEDDERHFSMLAARGLQIPIQHLDVDAYGLFAQWDHADFFPPEPLNEPFFAIQQEQLRAAAAHGRLALTGQGGDPAFSTSVTHYASTLLKTLQWGRLLADFWRFARTEGRASRLYLRTRWRVLRQGRQPPPQLPSWLNLDLARRLKLRERLARLAPLAPSDGVLRPSAYASLARPFWPYVFESYDPGVTALPIHAAHPYFDLRLLRFLLRIPPVPWCTDKELLRVSMRSWLPDEVRLRRKTPLRRDPATIHLAQAKSRWWEAQPPNPALSDYVAWESVPRLTGQEDPSETALHLGPFALNLWLHKLNSRGSMQRLNTVPDPEVHAGASTRG